MFHTSAKGISSETDWAGFLLRRATGRVLRDTDVTGRGLTLSGVVRCMIGAPGRSYIIEQKQWPMILVA